MIGDAFPTSARLDNEAQLGSRAGAVAVRRVLVTGAGGFIGRHVVAALRSRGAEVVDAKDLARDLLRADERAEAVRHARADTLVHLAWVTDEGFWSSDLNLAWEAATVDLVAGFLAAGGRRVVASGSCAEYDWSRGGTFSEDAPLMPHSLFGAVKARTGEALLRAVDSQGASAAWARVFFLFGCGERPARLVPSMLRACAQGRSLACGPRDTVRDFWAVRNVGEALAALALSELTGPVNVASGQGVSFGDLGALAERFTEAPGRIRFGDRALGKGEPRLIVADTARLRTDLGFQAPVSLEAGMAAYCKAIMRAVAPV